MRTDFDKKRFDPWTGGLLAVVGFPEMLNPGGMTGETLSSDGDRWRLQKKLAAVGDPGFPFMGTQGLGVQSWLLGEMYGLQDPERLALEVVSGERSARDLNGHFLLLGYNARKQELTVVTDRFGTVHAYLGAKQGATVVGTSFSAVAAAVSQRQLDWTGITGFFGTGFFPGNRTYYEDVRILEPATHYVFDDHGATVQQDRYWSWPETAQNFESEDEALEAFGDTFLEVMREMLDDGRVAVPISGGLDSRSTVAAIGPDKVDSGRVWSLSYGYGTDSVETAIASRIAKARCLQHSTYEIRPYLFDRLPEVMNCVEGFQDITQCRQAAVTDELAQRADWLIAAHWGDVWLDSPGVGLEQASDQQLAQLAINKMWKRGGDWLVDTLCVPQLSGEEPRHLLKSILQDQLCKIPEDHEPDFRLKALKTETWGFRWTLASLRMYQAAVFPRLPFFDTRVTDILGAIPSRWLEGRKLQVEFLKRYAPDLARIKWQQYDADLFTYHRFNTLHLPRRAIKKAVRMLRGKQPAERNWEVQLLGTEGNEGLQEWLLRKGLRIHDLLPKHEAEQLVARFQGMDRDPALGYTVSMLLTFSAWLELHG